MLLLASGSPRRADLLRAAGITFEVVTADVDESPLEGESPEAHVRRLAETKARTAAARRPGAVVLGADTVVAVDGSILGKPSSPDDAATMLRLLSGRAHEVFTGVAVIQPETVTAHGSRRQALIEVARTRVWFAVLSEADIRWYVQSGEPMDKAGAYAIQGLGSRFVERIDGSYSNVVGLPVASVWRLLQNLPEIRQSAVR